MLKRYTFFIIFILLIIFTAVAQEDNWNDPDYLIDNPQKAREHWQDFTEDQKNNVYARSDGLKLFSQEFSNEKGLKSLDASFGQASYENGYLKNGDSSFPVEYLEGAEVKSLQNGGFEIKFPDNSILNDLQFDGGTNGITFEGNNLQLDKNLLLSGEVTIFDSSHFRIEPNSQFQTSGIVVKTESQDIDLYYGNDAYANNFIRIYNDELEVVGNGLEMEFLENHPFRIVSVDGAVKIVDGTFEFEFDGNGNAYAHLPLGQPATKIEIKDEDAPEKTYALNPQEEPELASLEGGICLTDMATGGAIIEISGRVSQGICRGPLVQTGVSLKSGKYETILDMNKEQLNEVKNIFLDKYGREPDLSSDNDLKELSKTINDKVTEMKFTQKFLEDNSYFKWIVDRAIRGWIDSGLDSKVLTDTENKQVDTIVDIVYNIKKGDTLRFESSGDNGLVVYTQNGVEREIPVSGRLTKAYARNYYDTNLNVPQQSRDLLKAYFGKKVIVSR
ncbi:hypothetical protein HYW20_04900 [Candidatus Woesearchaeota archaeon]|nr:hypothetical protein [Candidatus Woesearchaeota archaeon]